MKEKNYMRFILYIALILLGFMLGMLFIYKVEINTVNQALYSMDYCYKNYYHNTTNNNLLSYDQLKNITNWCLDRLGDCNNKYYDMLG